MLFCAMSEAVISYRKGKKVLDSWAKNLDDENK